MPTIKFKVKKRLPPKRNGQMWTDDSEREKTIALRKAALGAFGANPAFNRTVHLTLRISVGRRTAAEEDPNKPGSKGSGDLDNFVSGVCDGLGKPEGGSGDKWNESMNVLKRRGVKPDQVIAFLDDKQVVKIVATKKYAKRKSDQYTVAVTGEQ